MLNHPMTPTLIRRRYRTGRLRRVVRFGRGARSDSGDRRRRFTRPDVLVLLLPWLPAV